MTKANECTCPSGNGSLRHPCPAHPASVEQAGGDERAAFELFVRKHCGMPAHIAVNWDAKFTNDAWAGWQARAALAQPSPAQAAQAEPERPEVVAVVRAQGFGRVCEADANTLYQHCSDGDELMTVAQHDRIVGELRADRDSWAEQAEQRLADWDEMRKERDAALARVAELERQEPVALANRGLHAFWVKWTEAAAGLYGPGIKLYAAPVVQAQHSVPEGVTIERDVAGTIHIKVGDFDFIQLQYQRPYTDNASTWKLAERIASLLAAAPGNSAQHSVPEGWMLVECGIWTQEQVDEMQKTVARFRNSEFVDDRALAMAVADAGQCKAPEISLAELLAAAPGKEGL
ncbi:hypothetical protein [Pseudomonas aeruginosa]|uniref:hypothetical protein n=2 Tax=Pseudomonas aeruginosa TaxID=287 RepID=UPI0018DFF706|nr:hypothetical protein [Pseudomonas aeruginosa]